MLTSTALTLHTRATSCPTRPSLVRVTVHISGNLVRLTP